MSHWHCRDADTYTMRSFRPSMTWSGKHPWLFCEKWSDQLQNRRNPSCCKSQNVFNNRLIFRLISLAAEAQLGVFLADAFTLWPDKGTSNWFLHSMIFSLKAKAYPCLSYNDRTSRCKTKTVKYTQLRWMKRKRSNTTTHTRTHNKYRFGTHLPLCFVNYSKYVELKNNLASTRKFTIFMGTLFAIAHKREVTTAYCILHIPILAAPHMKEECIV